ncbi:hypothetical protein AOCH_001911 [Aspergillus ochraceoroseus]|uniref:HECT-type E3 ubiquitin transferase n=1 Tax=Aspergillus ochraceoroseus TaxID=138278 RepID=A0A0F8UNQ5_9EURO|nr:hypothetical protein AOCH_001911 [Aspergillus ochraceoroseus]
MPSRAALNSSDPPTSRSAAVHPSTAPVPLPAERNLPRLLSQDVPALPPMTGNPATSPPVRRGHSRSISHPFTSPFAGIGKSRNKSISKQAFLDSDDDDDDDDGTRLPNLLSSSPRKGVPRPAPGEELTTGKCMTCSSTVRWPRSVKVFRCTECLTVNDLEPCQETKETGSQGTPGKNGKPPQALIPRRGIAIHNNALIITRAVSYIVLLAIPLSVERTKSIINGCILAYLQSRLDTPTTHALPMRSRSDNPFCAGQDENSLKGSGRSPGYLSAPQRPRDPRSRSASASERLPQLDRGHDHSGDSPYLKPSFAPIPPPKEARDSQMKPREAQNTPRSVQSRDPGRSPEYDNKEGVKQPYVFQALEEYIISAFKGCEVLNVSFTTPLPPRATATTTTETSPSKRSLEQSSSQFHSNIELDPKTLLLGDLTENSSWWMVDAEQVGGSSHGHPKHKTSGSSRTVNSRSPRINWPELTQWYQLIMTAGTSWVEQWSTMKPSEITSTEDYAKSQAWDAADLSNIEKGVTDSRVHLHRTLLKATENLLKRPRRPLKKPDDIRFLLLLLANPLMYPSSPALAPPTTARNGRRPSHPNDSAHQSGGNARPPPPHPKNRSGGPSHHSGIVKRIVGLIANLPNDCHHYLVSWLSRFPVGQFEKIVELVGSFVTYRLTRQHGRKRSESAKDDNSLVPSFSSAAMNTPAELHAAINGRTNTKQTKGKQEKPVVYGDDWQIRAAGRMMALLFAANNSSVARKPEGLPSSESSPTSRQQAAQHGHMIPITKFSFCQYPFFLSIWAKIHIMEHDARRQMEVKAREAFFSSILNRKAVSQYLVLKVRRDCLVEDSLQSVGEVIGSSHEEIKKGLRIEFAGEEGIDAGGLRKEWFLLLVREIFDPLHGLFIYDEDSRYCYFNPYCFESSEQFFLVGVLLGLAIYNSTILDIALPPFAFKKLLAAAPPTNGPLPSTSRPQYEGDVADTFCYDFVTHVDRYGEVVAVPLCPGGEKKPVTNANRREFVDLYVHYQLDTAITRQFEPFRRGFFTVCAGNALSLFRPEEIELLVRGSDEPLDVRSLRAVATYDNWGDAKPEQEPRKILSFVTGSDRIPAMGATSLMIRLVCLGEDSARFPTARTCFNQLGLYRYATRDKFERMLWEAVLNSEGFGLK